MTAPVSVPTRTSDACPLCAHGTARPSWFGATRYADQQFTYVECESCHSLFCRPMPDAATVARMYGPEYQTHTNQGGGIDDPKEPEHVLDWLGRSPAGTFVDYGCGAGGLLQGAARLGWRAIGFELDPAVARNTAAQTGATVLTDFERLRTEFPADVLHMGDVLEHLTDLEHQFPQILGALKPGGILIAQGPLEANMNLFTLALRCARSVRRSRVANIAPYHVLLATAAGQHALFRRIGLEDREYVVREVSWPAPSRLGLADLSRPRRLALFGVRQLSKSASAIGPSHWGNRYFYVGRWAG
jgi:SAM-dependent methyltransferase